MGGIPQVCVNYPEYKVLNDEFNIALLVDNIKPETLANAMNELLNNENIYQQLRENTLLAREQLNWQTEEIKLLNFWKNIFI